MAASSETIYTIGLVLIGASGLITAIVVPIFVITGFMFKRRLEDEYGISDRQGKDL